MKLLLGERAAIRCALWRAVRMFSLAHIYVNAVVGLVLVMMVPLFQALAAANVQFFHGVVTVGFLVLRISVPYVRRSNPNPDHDGMMPLLSLWFIWPLMFVMAWQVALCWHSIDPRNTPYSHN